MLQHAVLQVIGSVFQGQLQVQADKVDVRGVERYLLVSSMERRRWRQQRRIRSTLFLRCSPTEPARNDVEVAPEERKCLSQEVLQQSSLLLPFIDPKSRVMP